MRTSRRPSTPITPSPRSATTPPACARSVPGWPSSTPARTTAASRAAASSRGRPSSRRWRRWDTTARSASKATTRGSGILPSSAASSRIFVRTAGPSSKRGWPSCAVSSAASPALFAGVLDGLDIVLDLLPQPVLIDLGQDRFEDAPGLGRFPAVEQGDAQVDLQIDVAGGLDKAGLEAPGGLGVAVELVEADALEVVGPG